MSGRKVATLRICRWSISVTTQSRSTATKVYVAIRIGRENEDEDPSDIGIDLVGKIHGENGYTAIQAKFRKPDVPLTKKEIDSFIAASDGHEWTHRVVIDTTTRDMGKNLRNEIDAFGKPFTRIRITDLERSSVDWSSFPTIKEIRERDVAQRQRKSPREHQLQAIEAVRDGFKNADRGQIVMACGTGKTYTAQLIAEDRHCVFVLVLVPSLALVSQTVADWCSDASVPIHAIAVCSDTKVGKRRVSGGDDSIQYDIHDLAFPATTDAGKLAERIGSDTDAPMTVVFSTYHSLDTVAEAQHEYGMAEFDMVVCDEAHRTTGQIDMDREASNFVRVHDGSFLRAKKRLYMTATPPHLHGCGPIQGQGAFDDSVHHGRHDPVRGSSVLSGLRLGDPKRTSERLPRSGSGP